METNQLSKLIESVDVSGEPSITFIKRAETSGPRVGVFASSFNPITVAHIELMRRAAEQFSLNEVLALAGKTNADKLNYDCSLKDRLKMLLLALENYPQISVGVSSHAYFTDMLDALDSAYPRETDLHFVVGFDTFERVLDREDRYTRKYHMKFSSRAHALEYLLERSRLIVAGRAGAGRDHVSALAEQELKGRRERILYLDFPSDLGELSATKVRSRLRAGLSIRGLVAPSVESYIFERGLYRTGSAS